MMTFDRPWLGCDPPERLLQLSHTRLVELAGQHQGDGLQTRHVDAESNCHARYLRNSRPLRSADVGRRLGPRVRPVTRASSTHNVSNKMLVRRMQSTDHAYAVAPTATSLPAAPRQRQSPYSGLDYGADMKLSARNQIPARVTGITQGEAIANVVLDAGGVRLVASITVEAVRELGLKEGSEVTAVVKASDVMLVTSG